MKEAQDEEERKKREEDAKTAKETENEEDDDEDDDDEEEDEDSTDAGDVEPGEVSTYFYIYLSKKEICFKLTKVIISGLPGMFYSLSLTYERYS